MHPKFRFTVRGACLLCAVLTGCEDTIVLEGDQLHVQGTVYSIENRAPIPGATVFACGQPGFLGGVWCSAEVTADANGVFELVDQLPVFTSCPLRLRAEADGFVSDEAGLLCTERVQDVSVGLQPTALLTVEFEFDRLQLTVGQEYQLRAEVRAPDGTLVETPLSWSTSLGAIATVTTSGLITAIVAGQTVVVAEAGGTPDSVFVTTVEPPAARTGPTAYVTTIDGVLSIDVASGAILGPAFDIGASGLGVAPGGQEVWTASEPVRVIDVSMNTLTGVTIPVGTQPRSIALTPDGSRAYLTSDQAGTVTVIDTDASSVTGTLATPGAPFDIAMTPDGRFAFVTDIQDDLVRRLDLTADTFFASSIVTQPRPSSIAVTPDGTRAYVTLQFSAGVSVLDVVGDSLVNATIAVGSIPEDVLITPDGTTAFVASIEANTVSVMDVATNSVRATINVNGGPEGLAVTPNGETVWVTSVNQGTLRRIDVASLAIVGPAIAAGRNPARIVITP